MGKKDTHILRKAFREELVRDKKAKLLNFNNLDFINYYSKRSTKIEELNKGEFWDKKLFIQNHNKNRYGIDNDRQNLIIKEVNRIFKIKNNIKLLDIGIGKGNIEQSLNKKGIKIYGIDISKIAINQLKEKIKGHFQVGDATKLSYPNNYFDVILALEILEHIPPCYTFKVLSEINRVLKTNGYLLITIPTNEELQELVLNQGINPNKHCRTYTVNIVLKELEISGFFVYKTINLYAFSTLYKFKNIIVRILSILRIKIPEKTRVNNLVIYSRKNENFVFR